MQVNYLSGQHRSENSLLIFKYTINNLLNDNYIKYHKIYESQEQILLWFCIVWRMFKGRFRS